MKFKYGLLILIIVPTIGFSFFQFYNLSRRHTWDYIVEKHLKKYPDLEPQDIYQLVYEGSFGYNYSDCSRNSIYNAIKQEFNNLKADHSCTLIEKISPHNEFIRINLRKFKACHGDLLLLCEIVYKSQKNGNGKQLEPLLQNLTELIKKGKLDYNRTKWLEFYHSLKTNHFPPPKNSFYLNTFYNSTYVVVSKDIWNNKTRGMFD